jgi:hypothetical protein
MFVTPSDRRGGVLVAVISGGRPELSRRPVRHYLSDLKAFGPQDTIWAVSDADADAYERDEWPVSVYPRSWAEEYAATHWMLPTPPEPGGFLGAFPGREWACREAERRGCWAVLQLDDNINWLCLLRGTVHSKHFAEERGGLALFTDLLAGVALSTNARTVGAQLDAVSPSSKQARKVARPGFPYSLFLERVGPGREEWYGPFEDDITHSFQYGGRADGATAAVMPVLHYKKEPKSKTGMRQHYGHTRAVQLQHIFPESAKVAVRATHSNGRGGARVFHTMQSGSIRNPLIVHDHDLFGRVRDALGGLVQGWYEGEVAGNRDKIIRRSTRSQEARS